MEFKLNKVDVYIICEALELLAQRKRDKADVYREAYVYREVYGKIEPNEDMEYTIMGLEELARDIDGIAMHLLNQTKK